MQTVFHASRAKYHYIYVTTCLVTGRYYIGMHSTDNLDDGYLGSGKRLWQSIKKHGREQHKLEILEFLPDRASLKIREAEHVNEERLKLDPFCMNLSLGGGGGWEYANAVKSKEQVLGASKTANKAFLKRLATDPRLKELQRLKGVHMCTKIIESGKHKNKGTTGLKHSIETIELMRVAKQGKLVGAKNPQHGKRWIHKDGTAKAVRASEIDGYLLSGWRIGRKLAHDTRNSSHNTFGRVWANDGSRNYLILPDKLGHLRLGRK